MEKVRNKQRYLLAVEIREFGYISDAFDDYEEALSLSERISGWTSTVRFGEWKALVEFLTAMNYTRYECNGDFHYLTRSERTETNGHISVSIVKVDRKRFSLRSYIRERENCSLLGLESTDWYRENMDGPNLWPN